MNKYRNLTASALLKTGTGTVAGIIINSHTSGTVKLWDSTSEAGTVIVNTITFSAVATTGERSIPLFDASFVTGLFVTIGGTADLTIVYK